jgi:hypothetical protein
VKPKLKAVNKPLHHCIVHGLDNPGSSATVSIEAGHFYPNLAEVGKEILQERAWRESTVARRFVQCSG